MRKCRNVALIIFGLVLFGSNANAYEQLTNANGYMRFRFSYQPSRIVFGGMSFTTSQGYNDSTLEYSFAVGGVSWVNRNRGREITQFSFQGAYSLLSVGVMSLADVLFMPQREGSVLTSPLRYVLFAPVTTLRYQFKGSWLASFDSNTELLFVRSGGADRGILYTPSIGIGRHSPNDSFGRGGWNLTVGPTFFWNFDNRSSFDGWTFSIRLYMDFLGN